MPISLISRISCLRDSSTYSCWRFIASISPRSLISARCEETGSDWSWYDLLLSYRRLTRSSAAGRNWRSLSPCPGTRLGADFSGCFTLRLSRSLASECHSSALWRHFLRSRYSRYIDNGGGLPGPSVYLLIKVFVNYIHIIILFLASRGPFDVLYLLCAPWHALCVC